jgi:hypothetical protein
VVFSSLAPSTCIVTGGTVTGVAAGTCTVAANQAGNGTYDPAPQATQSITLGKSGQTITFGAAPSVAVGGTGTLSASASSQLPVVFSSLTPSTCSVTGSTVVGLAPGACTVAANQAGNGTYDPAPQATQSFTLGKIGQSITFGAAPSVAVGGTGTLSASASSQLPAAFSSLTPSTCSVTGSTVAGLAPGTCTVAANQAGNGTYDPAPQILQSFSIATLNSLSVTSRGTGSGRATSDFGGINCEGSAGTSSGTCMTSLVSGSTVRLTAVTSASSTFSGWSGDCTGTETCIVTLNAARNVTATFRLRPFIATANSVITPTSASINTRITFNPSDVGKQGFVFVTAWMPLGGLNSLGSSSATSGDVNVISTLDNPYLLERQRELRVTQASLEKTDASSNVLVQLTASGWQLVVNGQLIPYASGVLGDLLAAQTLLKNANPVALVGTQFCLGYGTSAEEMIATGRMLPITSIPDPRGSTSTGSCNVAASTPVSTYSGLWWNQSESGWGLSLTQRDAMAMVAWYTYDAAAQPSWMIISSCPISGEGCAGDLYNVTGGTRLDVPWSGSSKVVSNVGSGSFTFSDDNTGTLNYTINGASGRKELTRMVYAQGSSKPIIDYSALWWNESVSGWGVTITQQYGIIFAVIYTYDAGGKPFWYIASSCPITGISCSGDLYQVTGGTLPTVPWSGANPAVSKVGAISFEFNDSSVGTIKYTINGVSGTKAISRLLF